MKTALIYSEKIKKYDFGEGHPFRGDRFQVFMNFFKENFPQEKFKIIEPEEVTNEEILLVHDKKYMETMKAASEGITEDIYGYVSGDNLNPLTRKVPKGIEEGAKL